MSALKIVVGLLLLPAVLLAGGAPDGIHDALALQKTRERFVRERGAKTFYHADRFDLSGLPAYGPDEQFSGTLRNWGNNYLADSGLAQVWEEEFRKAQPGIQIEW